MLRRGLHKEVGAWLDYIKGERPLSIGYNGAVIYL